MGKKLSALRPYVFCSAEYKAYVGRLNNKCSQILIIHFTCITASHFTNIKR